MDRSRIYDWWKWIYWCIEWISENKASKWLEIIQIKVKLFRNYSTANLNQLSSRWLSFKILRKWFVHTRKRIEVIYELFILIIYFIHCKNGLHNSKPCETSNFSAYFAWIKSIITTFITIIKIYQTKVKKTPSSRSKTPRTLELEKQIAEIESQIQQYDE